MKREMVSISYASATVDTHSNRLINLRMKQAYNSGSYSTAKLFIQVTEVSRISVFA